MIVMEKKRRPIPAFKSEALWESHDSSGYVDWSQAQIPAPVGPQDRAGDVAVVGVDHEKLAARAQNRTPTAGAGCCCRTKSSLPGLYSHRKRRLLLKELLAELYWMSPLKNMRGLNA